MKAFLIANPKGGSGKTTLATSAGLSGKLLERVLKLSARVIVPVQHSTFDPGATRDFLSHLSSAKVVLKGKARVAVVGMTLLDLPTARTTQDLAQWQPILDWVGQG